MSPRQNIEKELRQFLVGQENLSFEDQVRALMAIFDKKTTFEDLTHQITDWGILNITSASKVEFVNMRLPMFIQKKQIHQDDLRTVAVVEAFLGYLNLHGLLNREVKINYTEGK